MLNLRLEIISNSVSIPQITEDDAPLWAFPLAQMVKNLPAMQETRETWDATPWAVQSMEFSRPEYWSGEPFPSPGDLPNPGIEPRSPVLQADS